MELWELNAILDAELEKPEAERNYNLIMELCSLLGIKYPNS